jgi:hypothetical protein
VYFSSGFPSLEVNKGMAVALPMADRGVGEVEFESPPPKMHDAALQSNDFFVLLL